MDTFFTFHLELIRITSASPDLRFPKDLIRNAKTDIRLQHAVHLSKAYSPHFDETPWITCVEIGVGSPGGSTSRALLAAVCTASCAVSPAVKDPVPLYTRLPSLPAATFARCLGAEALNRPMNERCRGAVPSS